MLVRIGELFINPAQITTVQNYPDEKKLIISMIGDSECDALILKGQDASEFLEWLEETRLNCTGQIER